MSTVLDLAIAISLADHVSGAVKGIIGQFKLLERTTSDVQRKMDMFKNIAWTGGAFTVAGVSAFAGLTSAIKASVDQAMEFQDVMNNVKIAAFGKDLLDKTKINEVKRTVDDLTAGFEKLGVATKFSDTTVAQAALGMLKGGLDKQFLLGSKGADGKYNYSGLAAAVYAAQLGGVDPSVSGDFIAKQKAAFNLTGDRTLDVTNFYAKTAAASTMDFKELISGMLTSSGVAGHMYLSPEDTALLVAATGTYTKDGSSAGTFTKDFLDRLMPHSKRQLQTMEKLGWIKDGKNIFFDNAGHIKGADFIVNTLQDTAKRFKPNEFEAMMSKVFLEQGKNTALALATKSNVYQQIKGNVNNQLDMFQQIDMQMSGTKNIMESLAETWNIVKRVFGEPFLDPLASAMQKINKLLGDFVIPWATAHPEIIKTVAAIGLAVSGFVTIGGAIMVGVAAIGSLTTVLSTTGISLGTIAAISGGVVLAIGAIAGAAYLLYENWDKIVPYAKAIWERFTYAVAPAVNWFKSNFVEPLNTGVDIIMGQFERINSWISSNSAKIESFFGFSRKNVKTGHDPEGEEKITWNVPEWAKGIIKGIEPIWSSFIDFTTQTWTKISGFIKTAWNEVVPYVVAGLKELWASIKQAWSAITNWTRDVWPNIRTIILLIWDEVKSKLEVGMAIIGASLTITWIAIKNVVAAVWPVIKDIIVFAWDAISGAISIGLKILSGDWSGAWKKIKETTANLWSDIKQVIWDGILGIGQLFKGLISDAWKWGENLISSFAKGLRDKVDTLPGPIKAAAQTVFDYLGVHSPTKEGPLRTNHLWGGNLMKSIADGMRNNLHLVKNAAAETANAMTVKGTHSISFEQEYKTGRMVRPSNVSSTDQELRGFLSGSKPLIGELHIHQQPGEDPEELGKRVAQIAYRELEKMSKKASLTISRVNPGVI